MTCRCDFDWFLQLNYLPKLTFREEFEENFTPPYSVWKQRFCLAPGGDFFKPIREGKASVKTGHIETLTENGIQMKDGSFVEVRESWDIIKLIFNV